MSKISDVPCRHVGASGYPALLIDSGMISRRDLSVAERYAEAEHILPAGAVVLEAVNDPAGGPSPNASRKFQPDA